MAEERKALRPILEVLEAHLGLQLSPREWAELVWLGYQWLNNPPESQTVDGQHNLTQSPTVAADATHGEDDWDDAEDDETPKATASFGSASDADGPTASSDDECCTVVFLPTLPALEQRLPLTRALHRLGGALKAPGQPVLQILDSVKQSAAARNLQLVFKSEMKALGHLILAIDVAFQLIPWEQTTREFQKLLSQVNAFSSQSLLKVDLSQPDRIRWSNSQDEETNLQVQLHPGKKHLFLLFSDGLGQGLTGGILGKELSCLPAGTYAAMLNPWDRPRWYRAPFTRLRIVKATSLVGPANASRFVPLTIAEFGSLGLNSLEDVVRGRPSDLLAYQIPTDLESSGRLKVESEPNWSLLLQRLPSYLEPGSMSLLALAAAIPGQLNAQLLLSLGRYLPEPPKPQHLADVLTSGLFQRCGGSAFKIRSEEARQYLLTHLERGTVVEILRHLVDEYFTGDRRDQAKELGIPIQLIGQLLDRSGFSEAESQPTEGRRALTTIVKGLFPGIDITTGLWPDSPKEAPSVAKAPKPPSSSETLLQIELAKLVRQLQDDLRQRCDELPEVGTPLQEEYQESRRADRTTESFTSWRENYLNQVSVAWVLASLFLRYLEDNGMLDEVWLSGLGPRRNEAQERYSEYFRAYPEHNDRDYFQHVFDLIAKLPGCADLFGRDKTPLWKVGLSGDGAKKLRSFWWDIDPSRGAWSLDGVDTRFLGDLYQNLSEEARSRFALLQTPDFVESFILDRTLEPALRDFGLEEVRLIDPTCGSGHFLLGAFHRLLGHWRKNSNENPRVLARKALEAVNGIDINPFAVAIARFRLLLAFLQACGFSRLKDMPDIHPRVASGDSLLYARRVDRQNNPWLTEWLPEPYTVGDYGDASRILSQQYHAVVGNPPYITAKDKRHNEVVRSLYYSCHMKYSLGVPFTERFFDLAVPGPRAGYVGMITANSFMKREFGKKLIEEVLPRLDLTHVLDTSRAHIPGHGTPTVILLGRNRPPTSPTVRAVLGIRAESTIPENPSEGLVWSSIARMVDDEPGAQNAYVSVADVYRTTFAKHPWSMGGGGASDLKDRIEVGRKLLGSVSESIGFASFTGQDDVFASTRSALLRSGIGPELIRPFVEGDCVRDYTITPTSDALVPYDSQLNLIDQHQNKSLFKYLWPYRVSLENIKTFGNKTKAEAGEPWWGWYRWVPAKYRTPLSISFAFVATHNHFVLDRGGKVFKQSAPVIKLPTEANESEHFALLGLLNSSIACFWSRQMCHSKGGGGIGGGIASESWEQFLEFTGTQLEKFPLTEPSTRSLDLARQLNFLAEQYVELEPARLPPTREDLASAQIRQEQIRGEMVFLQEELDWHSYQLYGVLEQAPLSPVSEPLLLGERAFEISLARSTEKTTWFDRHHATPRTDLPTHWSSDYQAVVQERLELIGIHPDIRLLERPEHKRRWHSPPWEDRVKEALRGWLLDRSEAFVQKSESLLSVSALVDKMSKDSEFLEVLALYRGRDDLHLVKELTDLLLPEGVPYLACYCYSQSGLRIRAEWEKCWELQRRQDAGEKVEIAVPPKYGSKDFLHNDYWRLRGKLDVPKERFILFPGAEREADTSGVLAWAGWNHLQRAAALATYLLERKENDGWGTKRLEPLLAGLAELIPWLKQWHNEVDNATGERLGDYYEAFLREEARGLGLTVEAVSKWQKPEPTKGRSRAKT